MRVKILKDEYWWGGIIRDAENMPYCETSEKRIDLRNDRDTQSAPLYLSSKGRYIWSEEPFVITFSEGIINIESKAPLDTLLWFRRNN